ncbi:hypothetical protein ACH5RR_040285 [Cinchona calisaya]|uniref:Phorbol-ester/DAG-type domain-containing protein n=1 Tax=Cinchona calisaya TaxID=153742 RepID=A0ABD2XVP4_9GENT
MSTSKHQNPEFNLKHGKKITNLCYINDGLDSTGSSVTADAAEEDLDHHLLTLSNSDLAFFKEKPVRANKGEFVPVILDQIKVHKKLHLVEMYWFIGIEHLEIPDSGIYGCKKCRFFIHWLCSRLKQQLNHPFHPQHALSLYVYDDHNASSEKKLPPSCNACGITCSSHIYHCAECKFYLDDSCIKIMCQLNNALPPKSNHPHPLVRCSGPDKEECTFSCSLCGKEISENTIFCVCFECKKIMDISCSHLPQQIRHPFHIEHTLDYSTEVYAQKDFKCNACSWSKKEFYMHSSFICSQCDFRLHESCASLIPVSSNTSPDKELQYQPLITQYHDHPLIECYSQDRYHGLTCSGCNLYVKGSIFVCLKCNILLDKYCTELLPQIRHPFHPTHPLSLFQNIKKKQHFECRGCKETTYFFTYVCWKCNFHLHPRCAMIRAPRLIKSAVHQHPLAFLKTKLIEVLLCNTCRGPCENNFFQCLECKFGLHLECHPELPKVIKHSCHCDPLTLAYSRIQEIPDDDIDHMEFYCYACEEIRDPDDPTYYCKDCPFVAHLHCVMSEIVYHIETKPVNANMELSKSGEYIEEFQDKIQTNSTEVPNDEKAKERVIAIDEEIIKENIVAQDEDIISRKKFAKLDEETAKEKFSPINEDNINKKVTASQKEIVEEKIAAEDTLMKKVPGSHQKIVVENVTKQDKDAIKNEIAAIDEEIAAIQTKIKELKERRNQFLHLDGSIHKRIKHFIRKLLHFDI